MANAKQYVFKMEIEAARLESLTHLLQRWQEPDQGTVDPQQWRAAVDVLRDDSVLKQFCTDTGHCAHTVDQWCEGRILPNKHLCGLYLNVLLQKIAERQQELQSNITQTHKSAEKKAGSTRASRVSRKRIVRLTLPKDMDPKMSLSDIEGYETLSVRIRNGLLNGNIHTVTDVAEMHGTNDWEKYCLQTPNFGKQSTTILYQFLVGRGFVPVYAE